MSANTGDQATTVRRSPPRLSSNRKLALAQAQEKAWDLFRGVDDERGINVTVTPPGVHCPLCFVLTPFKLLTEEHLPPAKAPSRFGRAAAVALSCRPCNEEAGRTFERSAARARSRGWQLAGHADERSRFISSQGLLVVSPSLATDVLLTDIKAAYLLAWLTLGYGWAHTVRLNGLRASIRTRQALNPNDACVIGHLRPDFSEKILVTEFTGTEPCVLVSAGGGSGFGVLLPCHGTPDGPLEAMAVGPRAPSNSLVRPRRHDVPATVGSGPQVDREWDAERLFHIDRCNRDHDGTGVTSRESVVAEVLYGARVG